MPVVRYGTLKTETSFASPQPAIEDRGAVVIGGDYRGLGVVRSLGRRGIPVCVCTDEHLIAAKSRFCTRRVTWPAGDDATNRDFLLDLADRHQLGGWLLFPTGDESAAFVAREHSALAERFIPTTPPWDTFQWAYDKHLTYQLAEQLQIGYPSTYQARSRSEVEQFPGPFPVILKPTVKPEVRTPKAWRADDRPTLLSLYDRAAPLLPPGGWILQELVPGGGEAQLSFAALCDAGEPLAWVVARRSRQHPVDFGRSSTFVETIEDRQVETLARAVLARLRFTGLAEVEFKRDPRDGSCKLLDINARVWGWHTIGRTAGLDFPHLLWAFLLTHDVQTAHVGPGMRWLRLSTDLPAAVGELRTGRLSARRYFRSLLEPHEPAIFARDDPLPGLLEVPLLVQLATRRAART